MEDFHRSRQISDHVGPCRPLKKKIELLKWNVKPLEGFKQVTHVNLL